MKSKIQWEAIAPDDFKAVYGDYLLRAEQMDKKAWWFQAYHKNVELAIETFAPTEETAKVMAEFTMYQHLVGRIDSLYSGGDVCEEHKNHSHNATGHSEGMSEEQIEKIITDHMYGDGVDAKSAAKKITGKWGMGMHGREVWHIYKDDSRLQSEANKSSEGAYETWAIDYFLQKYEKGKETIIAKDAWNAAIEWRQSHPTLEISEGEIEDILSQSSMSPAEAIRYAGDIFDLIKT